MSKYYKNQYTAYKEQLEERYQQSGLQGLIDLAKENLGLTNAYDTKNVLLLLPIFSCLLDDSGKNVNPNFDKNKIIDESDEITDPLGSQGEGDIIRKEQNISFEQYILSSIEKIHQYLDQCIEDQIEQRPQGESVDPEETVAYLAFAESVAEKVGVKINNTRDHNLPEPKNEERASAAGQNTDKLVKEWDKKIAEHLEKQAILRGEKTAKRIDGGRGTGNEL